MKLCAHQADHTSLDPNVVYSDKNKVLDDRKPFTPVESKIYPTIFSFMRTQSTRSSL